MEIYNQTAHLLTRKLNFVLDVILPCSWTLFYTPFHLNVYLWIMPNRKKKRDYSIKKLKKYSEIHLSWHSFGKLETDKNSQEDSDHNLLIIKTDGTFTLYSFMNALTLHNYSISAQSHIFSAWFQPTHYPTPPCASSIVKRMKLRLILDG